MQMMFSADLHNYFSELNAKTMSVQINNTLSG